MTEQERQAFINAISFEGEIEDCDGVLMFTVKKDFDPAAAFQGIYSPAAESPPFRIGVPYCIVDQMIWYTMDLYFECPGDMDEDIRTFPLSDSERECLKGKVFDYCRQLTGMSLLEYGLLHWPEDNEPAPELSELVHPVQSGESASQPISGFDLMELYVDQCIEQMVRDMERKATPEEWRNIVAEVQQHEELSDLRLLRRTADELTTYAAERQAGFEQHQTGGTLRQPETRNEWIRDVLRGMAEVNGADGSEFTTRFDRQLEEASGCFGVEMLPQSDQEHLVQSLRQYATALEQQDGDQSDRLMQVRDLLEDMTAYPSWDPDAIGLHSARDQVEEQLQRLTAQLQVPAYEQIHVLKVEPGRPPEEATIPNTLEAFQAEVGGDIELLDLDVDATLVCNEDGKTMGLPANRRVGGDVIAGTFLIVGALDGEFCSLSEDAASYYTEHFAEPISEPCPDGLKGFTFYIM